jgi:hypothetical protein
MIAANRIILLFPLLVKGEQGGFVRGGIEGEER